MSAVNPRFLEYLSSTFGWDAKEMAAYAAVATKPLKKSIRINTNKVSVADFKKLTEPRGWSFTASKLAPNVMYVDRTDTSTPLGLTPEHLLGLFYVQEVSASSSPWFLAGEKQSKEDALILDMSASPGGKTTQLAELFPDSFIVANDPARARLPQLFENLERMQCLNVGVTNYDARFFGRFPETFDKILLDAPCSGEGTAYKATGALEHWHIKNAKKIGRLQEQLAFAASQALKTGGTLAYSTCTLNTLENEGVAARILEKCPYLEQIPVSKAHKGGNGVSQDAEGYASVASKLAQVGGDAAMVRRFWPHLQGTGGFFGAKFRKTAASGHADSAQPQPSTLVPLSAKTRDEVLKTFGTMGMDLSGLYFYGRNGEVCAVSRDIGDLLAKFFFFRVGVPLGTLDEAGFSPTHAAGVLFPANKRVVELTPRQSSAYFAGQDFPDVKTRLSAGWVALSCGGLRLGVAQWDGATIMNLFPRKQLRVD